MAFETRIAIVNKSTGKVIVVLNSEGFPVSLDNPVMLEPFIQDFGLAGWELKAALPEVVALAFYHGTPVVRVVFQKQLDEDVDKGEEFQPGIKQC